MMHNGAFTYMALALACAGATGIVALGAASLFRRRIPAPLWLAPGIALACLGAVATLAGSGAARRALSDGPPARLLDLAATAYAEALHVETTALSLATLCFMVAVAVSSLSALRARHPVYSTLDALLPGSCGVLGAIAVLLLGALLGGFQISTTGLAAITAICGVGLGLVAVVRSKSAREAQRLAELRIGTAISAVLAVLSWTLACSLSHTAAAPTDPTHLVSAHAIGWTGLAAATVLLCAGGLAIASVWRHAITVRTGAGIALCGALMAVAGVARLAASVSMNAVRHDAFGGAIQDEPLLAVAALPEGRGLASEPRGQPLAGVCLVADSPAGWTARPLFATLDIQRHIERELPAGVALSELDTLPGCPSEKALLDGPLSTFERPVLAISGERMAAAVSGQEWFLSEGDLQILVSDSSLGDLPPRARARASRAVNMHWERAPEDTEAAPPPDGGEIGDWNYTAARIMLREVLLLEGPVPMLISNGSRAWLEEGPAGEVQLREAMEAAQRRELVLIPRKHWTIQDLTRFCHSVADMDDSRCVIRPENTARWSERTGLALPW